MNSDPRAGVKKERSRGQPRGSRAKEGMQDQGPKTLWNTAALRALLQQQLTPKGGDGAAPEGEQWGWGREGIGAGRELELGQGGDWGRDWDREGIRRLEQ